MPCKLVFYLVLLWLLTACAPQGLFYWGEYEDSLYERYVENDPEQTEAYVKQTIVEAETRQGRVPPGVYADYGFMRYRRGDKNGALDYFELERKLYPEANALMTKLIERVLEKNKPVSTEENSPKLIGEQP